MLRTLAGNDVFRLSRREHELAADFFSRFPNAERFVFDGRDPWTSELAERLRGALSGGLFVAPRCLLLRHTEGFDATAGAMLQSLLERAPESKEILVIASQYGAGRNGKTTFTEWLASVVKPESVNRLSGEALVRLAYELKEENDPQAALSEAALRTVALRSDGDAGRLSNDIQKLALLSRVQPVTPEVITLLTDNPEPESVTFAALDALVRGKRERALALLRREEQDRDAVFKLFGLLAWQVRLALQVKDEYERGERMAGQIARTIGAKPFSVEKLLPLLPTLSLARLKTALSRLAELDWEMKTGQTKPGVALDLFVWKF
jgi:DNA polymerase III delta subunit